MKSAALISLNAEAPLADGKSWVHLLPAGRFSGIDGRGPYDATDAEGIVLRSRDRAGSRQLVVDYNHGTDLAARRGGEAPAAGWIVGLQAREDGAVWGLVEWTDRGAGQIAAREYRYLSPVIRHDAEGRVSHILRAALVNTPNLELTALNSAEDLDMDDDEFLAKLRELLGLPADADKPALVNALASKLTSLNSTEPDPVKFVPIGEVTKRDQTIEALQSELNAVTVRVRDSAEASRRRSAETFVDQAISQKRAGVSARRGYWITLHMSDPANAEALMGALPALGPSHTSNLAPPSSFGRRGGVADELTSQIARNLGHDPDQFAAFRAARKPQE